MPRKLGLAFLTIPDLSPPAALEAAAALGVETIGIRLMPAVHGGPYWPLAEDKALLSATQKAMAATGVGVFDIEVLWISADFDAIRLKPVLEAAAAVGTKAMLCAGTDPEPQRLIQSYGTVCDLAAPYGITADLEFMPWTKVPDAKTALRVASAVGRANAGILVDALHFARSGSTLDDIRAIPKAMLHYAQICDAPAERPTTLEGLLHTARRERLLPGEGGIALHDLFAALPADLPVSLEIPNDARIADLGSRAWAQQALAATRRVLRMDGEG